MDKKQFWFVKGRAEALAFLLLTDRQDLRVKKPVPDEGIDFEVEVLHDGRTTGRLFAVEVKGTMTTQQTEVAFQRLKSRPIVMPLCFFAFAVQSTEGRYAWVFEPSVLPDGKPRLATHEHLELHLLDQDALENIVAQTDEYYDALVVALKGPA